MPNPNDQNALDFIRASNKAKIHKQKNDDDKIPLAASKSYSLEELKASHHNHLLDHKVEILIKTLKT